MTQNTMKHTPGPWTVDNDAEGEEGFFSVWYDHEGCGAEIAGRIGEEANARLIAAAPELLVALHAIERGLCVGNNTPHKQDAIEHCLRVTRAALAKATGDAKP